MKPFRRARLLAHSLTDTLAKFIPAERVINLTKLICSARPPKSSQPANQTDGGEGFPRREGSDVARAAEGGRRTKGGVKHLEGERRHKGRTDIKERG